MAETDRAPRSRSIDRLRLDPGDVTATRQGRANFILDNLIAEGKAKPMIVVMAYGYARQAHRELAAHCTKRRDAALPYGHQLRDQTAVPFDNDGLAVFHHVEQLRKLGLRAMDADVHEIQSLD